MTLISNVGYLRSQVLPFLVQFDSPLCLQSHMQVIHSFFAVKAEGCRLWSLPGVKIIFSSEGWNNGLVIGSESNTSKY